MKMITRRHFLNSILLAFVIILGCSVGRPLYLLEASGGSEIIIYDMDHWMDRLDSAELEKRRQNPSFESEYQSRYIRGDVVEIQPDGFFTGVNARGWNHSAFRLLCVQGITLNDIRYLMDKSAVFKRRYNISTGVGEKEKTVLSIQDVIIEDKNNSSKGKELLRQYYAAESAYIYSCIVLMYPGIG